MWILGDGMSCHLWTKSKKVILGPLVFYSKCGEICYLEKAHFKSGDNEQFASEGWFKIPGERRRKLVDGYRKLWEELL